MHLEVYQKWVKLGNTHWKKISRRSGMVSGRVPEGNYEHIKWSLEKNLLSQDLKDKTGA